jgi:hypothetical protein
MYDSLHNAEVNAQMLPHLEPIELPEPLLNSMKSMNVICYDFVPQSAILHIAKQENDSGLQFGVRPQQPFGNVQAE